MAEKISKRYDVVILGASGFTGKYVIREALKFLNVSNSPLKSLALAGRSTSRLAEALKWATAPNPPPYIPLLAADTTDFNSLARLAAHSRIILNCVGPFRLYGEPVVKACAGSGCDYLDICGEPEFMEKMEAIYHDMAVENGSLIISACGFDSIPAELGLLFHARQWTDPYVPNQVEAYLSLESDQKIVGNYGTYESLVLGVANADKLSELRKSRPRRARPTIPGPGPPKGLFEHQKDVGLWALKLPSADSTVVRRTFSTLTQNSEGLPGVSESDENAIARRSFWSSVKPAHFGVKLGSKSILGLLPCIILGIFLALLCRSSLGRWLLLKFPSFFSAGWFKKDGPSEDQVESASFKMWFIGRGFSDGASVAAGKKIDTQVVTRVTGPEIGYITTPIPWFSVLWLSWIKGIIFLKVGFTLPVSYLARLISRTGCKIMELALTLFRGRHPFMPDMMCAIMSIFEMFCLNVASFCYAFFIMLFSKIGSGINFRQPLNQY